MQILITELRNLLLASNLTGGLIIRDFGVGIQRASMDFKIYPEEEQRQDTLKIIFKGLLGTPENFNPLPDDHVFLIGHREDIIKAVKEALRRYQNSTTIDNLDDYFGDLHEKQESVMEHYKLYFALTSEEEAALHMFFSPTRVVAGLTQEEVHECISMYPKREVQKKLYPGMYPPHLHWDLIKNPDENISRTEGLRKAINEILADLENNQSIINS